MYFKISDTFFENTYFEYSLDFIASSTQNEDDKYQKEMEVIEVDDELAIKTCMRYNYKYSIITPNDFVIPPSNDNIQEN